GHVRVVVQLDKDGETELGFEFPKGPITPKPEKVALPKAKRAPRRKPASAKPKKAEPGRSKPVSSRVPKVPLVKA
ncbi:MAG TPA: hypothetical protein VIQ29_06180, partial [Ancylobacter sp.]